MRWRTVAALFAFAAIAAPAFAASNHDVELVADRLHSDLPLYDFSFPDIWPQHFSDANGDFGCTSRVPFGDWRFTGAEEESQIWRMTNYGVFHCAMIFSEGVDSAELEKPETRYEYGFIVRLGTIRRNGNTVELWVLQRGTIPGSNYILLARDAGPGKIESFTVLQRKCPSGHERKLRGNANLDIWATRYCAINSRRDLLTLAKAMLALPALGHLQLHGSQ